MPLRRGGWLTVAAVTAVAIAASGLGNSTASASGLAALAERPASGAAATWSPIVAETSVAEQASALEIPRVIDQRLKIELYAREPAIVTPTGLTVLPDGDVLVVESHTHFRPDDYEGPPADRVQRYRDTDGDGQADAVTTFYSGTTATMAIAAHPTGAVYLATRDELFRLQDFNGDGVAEGVTVIMRLKTPGTYPHNGLSGFAFDLLGNVYFGFGENLGEPYELIGSDGTTLSGGGEGGSIFRCDLNGKNLVRFATGFWNPFHLAFDDYGRLFAVDNDPDWRPPCRLLHVVEGGDYGYRFELGRRGTHPFSSWFGEVPGTLGMVSGTGEAPSGLLVYQSDGLPDDYNGSVLATSWGMHSIERFDLRRRGASFQSQAKTVIKGGIDFRPVAVAMAPDGSLYVSDWVKRSYELHGHGRVWRISAKEPAERDKIENDAERFVSAHRPLAQDAALKLAADPESQRMFSANALPQFQPNARLRSLAIQALISAKQIASNEAGLVLLSEPDDRVRELIAQQAPWEAEHLKALLGDERVELSPAVRAALLRRAESPELAPFAWQATESDDPFVRQAARLALQRCLTPETLVQLPVPEDGKRQLAWALLLMSTPGPEAKQRINDLLNSANSEVRFVALRWIGEQRLVEFANVLPEKLRQDSDPDQLFDAYLAAMDLLDPERTGAQFEKSEIRMLDELLSELDPKAEAELLELVLKRLTFAVLRDQVDEMPSSLQADRLAEFVRQGSLQAADVLGRVNSPEYQAARETLLAESLSPAMTAKLLTQVGRTTAVERQRLLRFALDPNAATNRGDNAVLETEDQRAIQRAALRTLVGFELPERELIRLQELAVRSPALSAAVDRLIAPESLSESDGRPPAEDLSAWLQWLEGLDWQSVSEDEGRRLFFHPRLTQCANCHQVDGQGGDVGPDLSHARQLGWERLVESILLPSREVAPKYESWTIVSLAGEVRTGVLKTERGSTQTYADGQGELFQIDFNDIEVRQPSTKSIMPEHLLDRLTADEIQDLLAYLRSLE